MVFAYMHRESTSSGGPSASSPVLCGSKVYSTLYPSPWHLEALPDKLQIPSASLPELLENGYEFRSPYLFLHCSEEIHLFIQQAFTELLLRVRLGARDPGLNGRDVVSPSENQPPLLPSLMFRFYSPADRSDGINLRCKYLRVQILASSRPGFQF